MNNPRLHDDPSELLCGSKCCCCAAILSPRALDKKVTSDDLIKGVDTLETPFEVNFGVIYHKIEDDEMEGDCKFTFEENLNRLPLFYKTGLPHSKPGQWCTIFPSNYYNRNVKGNMFRDWLAQKKECPGIGSGTITDRPNALHYRDLGDKPKPRLPTINTRIYVSVSLCRVRKIAFVSTSQYGQSD